nr:helix-turn-helix domain-containing protein [uncultured Oribacterium sp.]
MAKKTGFHNQGNFIKTFKTVMGETPMQYRKREGK